MNTLSIMLGILLLGGLFFGGLMFYSKLNNKLTQKDSSERLHATVQDNLPLESVRKGLVRLKDGTYLKILEVTPINIHLLEEEEMETLAQKYKTALMNMDFFTQKLRQSRSMDMQDYFEKLENKLYYEENNFNRKQLEFYIDFSKNMIQHNSIRTIKFFIVIPYNPKIEQMHGFAPKNILNLNLENRKRKNNQNTDDVFEKEEQFEQADRVLTHRSNIVVNSMNNLGSKTKILNDEELYNLYYVSYNKKRSSYQSQQNVFRNYIQYGHPLYVKGGGYKYA